MNLFNEDCLTLMSRMPDNCIDLTVTSPPYDNLRTYEGTLDWGEHVWRLVLQYLFRVTKPGGTVVWIVGDATENGSESGTSFKQALWAMQCGFKLHDTMIWDKKGFSNPSSNRYHQCFEYMFVFSKGASKVFNGIKDRENVSGELFSKNSGRNRDGSITDRKVRKTPEKFGRRMNIWRTGTVGHEWVCKRPPHPAMFPEKLARDHILSWSNPGGIVFDPFMGSGTTGRAAILNGREFIGVERVISYFEIAEKRIQEAINSANKNG